MISLSNPERREARSVVREARSAEREAQGAPRSALRALRFALHVSCLLAPCIFGGFLLGRHLWAGYHWRAAQIALEQHDLVRAREHLKYCLRVRRDPEIQFLAARTARRAGDFDEATQRLGDCERLEGTTPAVMLEQRLQQAQRGDLAADSERQLWSLVSQNHPDSRLILEALAQGYIYTYRLGTALACLERWLEQEPDCIQALLWRAQVCQSLHRYQEALDDYRRAVALEPAGDSARLQLAVFLAFSGRVDLAVDHFERLWQRQPHNPQVLLGLARCRDAQGRAKEAGQLLDAMLCNNPNDIPALRERGKVALHLGQNAEAEDWLRKCLALDPYDQEATYLLVLCLGRRGKEQEARAFRTRLERIDADLQRLEVLNRAVRQAPANAALRYQAGIICLRNGQEQEGRRWLKGALLVDPQYRPAQLRLDASLASGVALAPRDGTSAGARSRGANATPLAGARLNDYLGTGTRP
jgi:tetratricopeptide (TPR) repeat protein